VLYRYSWNTHDPHMEMSSMFEFENYPIIFDVICYVDVARRLSDRRWRDICKDHQPCERTVYL
jgi:hypothetical protein